MSEYMSFQEIIQVVKNGDKLVTSKGSLCVYKENVLRWNNVDRGLVNFPWELKLKIIKPKPEMVTLTRPKFCQKPNIDRPYAGSPFYKSKEDWFNNHKNWIVFGGWEEITVPKNREDWIDGDS